TARSGSAARRRRHARRLPASRACRSISGPRGAFASPEKPSTSKGSAPPPPGGVGGGDRQRFAAPPLAPPKGGSSIGPLLLRGRRPARLPSRCEKFFVPLRGRVGVRVRVTASRAAGIVVGDVHADAFGLREAGRL